MKQHIKSGLEGELKILNKMITSLVEILEEKGIITSEEWEQRIKEEKRLEDLKGRPANRKGKLMTFRWYGGKYTHLSWLLPLLPRTKHFCEPFAGSGVVLLNREPSPIETLNDIDGDIVNFFRILREKPEELIRRLYLTPFSYEEFKRACELKREENISDVERARLFFIRAEQVRIGLAQEATPGRWAWCKLTSRRGMAGAVSRWLSKIDNLEDLVDRLRRVQIENKPAIEVIKKYDSPETLFYCDPPYPHISRGDKNAYGYEMKDQDHRRLAEVLNSVQGLVALSGYRSSFMDGLYEDWTCIEAPTKTAHSVKQPRTEFLWVNYEVPEKIIRLTGSKVVYHGDGLKKTKPQDFYHTTTL
jgi:DNA adenine methylase